MANYQQLKNALVDVIKHNGNNEITGEIMQTTLLSMINSLGANYQFAGVLTPSTNFIAPDENVFLLGGAGTYNNFGTSHEVPVGSIGIFLYDGSFQKINIKLFEGIDNVSQYQSDNLLKSKAVYPLDIAINGYNELTFQNGHAASDGTISVDTYKYTLIPISMYVGKKITITTSTAQSYFPQYGFVSAVAANGNLTWCSGYSRTGGLPNNATIPPDAIYVYLLASPDGGEVVDITISIDGAAYNMYAEVAKINLLEDSVAAEQAKTSILLSDGYVLKQIAGNILDNNLSNFDTTKRLSASGTLVSNSDSPRYCVNTQVLSSGDWYFSAATGIACRISNGSELIPATLVKTGVYKITLSAITIVYSQWRMNEAMTALDVPAYISREPDFTNLDTKVIADSLVGLVELNSFNKIDLSQVSYSLRYSKAYVQIIGSVSSEKMACTGFIEVKDGETYCLSGDGIYGAIEGYAFQGGYFAENASRASGQAAIAGIEFYSAHGMGMYFTVPANQGIKYVLINLATNNDKTALAGNAQMEVGENPTEYQPYELKRYIKEELLPNKASNAEVDVTALDAYTTFENLHYAGIGDKIPNFREHYLKKDKDLVVVNTGTSLTARDYCTAHPDAAYRPPLMHTFNLASRVWDKLKWANQQYRRYDAKSAQGEDDNYFTEVGTFVTAETDSLWDDSSYRRCYTRLATSGNNSVSFKVPKEAWQFNFIYRTDAQGCENCVVAISEGNGKMEVWNGSAWVEANGYTFSMKQAAGIVLPSVTYKNPQNNEDTTITNVQVGGNTIYQKRLKMRCTSHATSKPDGTVIVAGEEKNVTISGTGRFMYWGVEWSPAQYMITYINAARGSHTPHIANSGAALIRYQDTDIWEFKPDLMLTEDPIFNGGGGSANSWFSGTSLVRSSFSFGIIFNNFFFADNAVSMSARGKTLFGNDYGLEFAIFSPYSTALDGKVSDYGELKQFPLADGYMWSVYDALQSIVNFTKENYPNLIYINCAKTWIECCNNVFGGITNATASSGVEGETLTSDGVHPNSLGSKVWARLVLPVLDFIV